MTLELPAAELGSGSLVDANAATRKRQNLIYCALAFGLGVPVLGYVGYTVFAPPKATRPDVARRMQPTVDAARSPVADTSTEELAGQVRDEKQKADQAQTDAAALQTQVNELKNKLQAQHDDAQHAVTALTKELETRSSDTSRAPGGGAGAPGVAAAPAQAAVATPTPSLTAKTRNPFAPTTGPLAAIASGAAGAAPGTAAAGVDGSDDAPIAHRSMSVIKASLADSGPRPGDNSRPSGMNAAPSGLAATVGSVASATNAALGGSKGYFSSKLEVYESAKFVPPNAYAEAKVLVGVDAATGTSYSADPKPVMFRITGPAIHVGSDGKFQSTDLTGCMVNGAAFGELPSEKVYIKLQKITCPSGPNKFSVATIEGYVSSKGKAGVRGQVISREGQFTLRALAAGTLNGLGQALSTNVQRSVSGVNTGTDASGLLATRALTPGQIATGSVGTGVSNAASMLADYYIKRAEQYQPVIEMPTGINVEIVFLSGFQVK